MHLLNTMKLNMCEEKEEEEESRKRFSIDHDKDKSSRNLSHEKNEFLMNLCRIHKNSVFIFSN